MRPAAAQGVPSDRLGPDEARRRWAADRRDAARRHHPDVGGSTDALLAAYAEVDARHGLVAGPGATGGVRTPLVTPTPWWRRLRRRAVRRLRTGSRRYLDIT